MEGILEPGAPHAVPACGSFIFRRSAGRPCRPSALLHDDCSAHIEVLELATRIKASFQGTLSRSSEKIGLSRQTVPLQCRP
jgi:hypothetical protein